MFSTYIFKQDRSAKLYAVLQRPNKVAVSQLNDVEIVGTFHVLDPLVRLSLGVDHERPPAGVAEHIIKAIQHSYAESHPFSLKYAKIAHTSISLFTLDSIFKYIAVVIGDPS